ncbi:MAG: DUF423 domain-containing protein [Methylococcaceae bacterium]|jgi:uncharacterized membrane protein YgdD (TMEM256/DUF423 family)
MGKPFLGYAAVAACLAVVFGAFGAHALRGHLQEAELAVYRTAVDYHMWHALGLAIVGLAAERQPQVRLLRWSGGLMLAGIVLFSGSLYALSLSGIRWLGMITPLGGLAFIVAWALLAVSMLRNNTA